MYGEDKTSLEELKNTVNELQSLKIEILPKADKTSDLNNSIEKMENQIKQVDENLLNNTQFAITSNETTENITEEQQQEIKTSENSNLNILISNIDTLTEKVNQAVKVETERKAEEERKAKEEAEKKAIEEAFANFIGTYVPVEQYVGGYGGGDPMPNMVLNKEGILSGGGTSYYKWRGINKKPISITKNADGSYKCVLIDNGNYSGAYYEIYPIGVQDANKLQTNKVRIVYYEYDGGVLAMPYYKK